MDTGDGAEPDKWISTMGWLGSPLSVLLLFVPFAAFAYLSIRIATWYASHVELTNQGK